MARASLVGVRVSVGAVLIFAFGCGGASARRGPGDDEGPGVGGAPNGTGGAGAGAEDAGGSSGEGGEPAVIADAGASGSNDPGCVLNDARCNAAFRREVCGADGWTETSFVCARSVAVSDENGSYCVTKGDGSYRCWGESSQSEPLPADDYVRVQRAEFGLIGLTGDGRLIAPELVLPEGLPPVVAFRATNMWGGHGVCPRFADGSFTIMRNEYDENGTDIGLQVQETRAPVLSAGCYYEGLAAAVMADGTIWSIIPAAPPGNDFVDVSMSVGTFCAIQTSGGVACFEPYLSCAHTAGLGGCVGPERPQFPPGRYHSLTSTWDAVCAIDEQGALVCRRFDGVDLPISGGPYVFAEAGQDVLCAVRRDGTTACFRQDGRHLVYMTELSAFLPVDPPLDPGW